MTLFARLVIIFCFLLTPFIISAQNSPGNATDITTQVFEAMPIEDKMNEPPQDLHAQFSQNPFGLPASQNQQMMDLFMQAFASDALAADAQDTFWEKYNAGYADSTARWLQMENTQRVLEKENEFYSLQGVRKRVVNKYELEQTPPTENRIALIESIAKNTSAVDSEIESQAIIFEAMLRAFSQLSDRQSFSDAQIDGFVTNYRNQISPQVERQVHQQLLLIYHELEDGVLEQYIDFYETAAGNWLSNTTSQASHEAYRAASDRFIESLQNL